MRSDNSANLDLLRSLAVMFVVLSHLPIFSALVEGRTYHAQTLGTFGVMIFFVHTCLVLMLSLDRDARKKGHYPNAWQFLVRRVFRIYPLSMFAVLTFSAITWLQLFPLQIWMASTQTWEFPAPIDTWSFLSNLLLVQNITGHESTPRPLWSLPYEIQMYLFLPLLYILVRQKTKAALLYLGILWAGAAAIIITFWSLKWDYDLIRFIPCFIPGVMAFTLWNVPQRLPAWVLFLLVGVFALVYPWLMEKGVRDAMVAWPACLMLGLLIPRCLEIQSSFLRAVGNLVARYSYGVYLFHSTVISIAFGSLNESPIIVQWTVFVIGLVLLPFAAYHLIEKPGIELGRKLALRLIPARGDKSHDIGRRSSTVPQGSGPPRNSF